MDQLLEASIFVVTIVSILLFGHLARIRNGANRSNMVPEAAGSWPIIGHLYLLVGSQVPHKALGSMADKFGPIFTIKLGLQRVLVVNNCEMAKECLTTKDRVFASRPNAMVIELMGYNYGNFAFTRNGLYWREIPKIVVLELLSKHHVQMQAHVKVSEVNGSIFGMYTTWKTNKGSCGMVKIDMKQWFYDLVANMITRMLFGDQFSHSEQNADEFKKAIIQSNELLGVLVPSDVIPGLRWFDLGGYETMMKKTAKKIDVIIDGWLEEHKKKMYTPQTKDERKAQVFMATLLSRVIEEDCYGFSTDTVVKSTCVVVSGYTVPKGTRLLVNIWKIQHDPRNWLNPFEFQPERFLTSDKEIGVNGQHFQLIPFSSGRRMCPGIHFAIEALLLILAIIIHVFEFKNPSSDRIDMTESHGLANLKPTTPVELLVAPRLVPHLSV